MNVPRPSHHEERPVVVAAGEVVLHGDLRIPAGARGVVLFAHGSGSSRHSPRNRFVAEMLGRGSFGTLLTDLLTADEERADAATGHLRFNIQLLGDRVTALTDWLHGQSESAALPVGLFGASTGAAAALMAAARRPAVVKAVVSRGGRPDMTPSLAEVTAPTLLIVGERDAAVVELNRAALARLGGEKALAIVPRAGHLFEEPGALEEVGRLAREWFAGHL